MARILIVEDNRDLAFGLTINLEHVGHRPTAVETGEAAVRAVYTTHIDLMLLDLILPDMNGMEVLRRVHGDHQHTPVIVVSALTEERTRVAALRSGATDYVTKPFSVLELIERIRLRLPSTKRVTSACQALHIDLERHTVTCRDAPVHLTPREFDVLVALIRAEGMVVSYRQLLQDVWCLPMVCETRTAVTHVGTLRRKLARAGLPDAVRTVHKCGVAWTLGNCIE